MALATATPGQAYSDLGIFNLSHGRTGGYSAMNAKSLVFRADRRAAFLGMPDYSTPGLEPLVTLESDGLIQVAATESLGAIQNIQLTAKEVRWTVGGARRSFRF